MRSSAPRAIGLFIVMSVALPTAQAPVRDRSIPAAGSGTIGGHVVAADTGAPVRIARVTLSGDPPFQTAYTVSDDAGGYVFRNLPAGRFTVSVSKNPYLTLSYGQTRPSQPGRVITLREREVVDNVNVALPLGGVIAGTVLDGFGDPVADATVTAWRTTYRDGRRDLVAVAPTGIANDLGEYRLSGLSPGSYLVSVRNTQPVAIGAVTNSTLAYLSTYAPGTVEVSGARRVVVELGKTVANVDVAFVRSNTGALAGRFVEPGGAQIAGAEVTLVQPGNPVTLTARTVVNRGTTNGFSFLNLAPATYDIRALTPGAGTSGDVAPRAAAGTVTVSGGVVSEVTLTAFEVPLVAGRVIVDERARTTVPFASVKLATRSADPVAPAGWNAARTPVGVGDRGAFALRVLPGRWLVVATLPRGWGLRAIRQRGLDVTDTGIQVQDTGETAEIEVELTDRPPVVSGRVRTTRGEPAGDYTALIFARDRERWNGHARYFAMARPDQSGSFSVDTLGPGEYYAIAMDYVDQDEAQNPELLERVSKDATPFTLGEAERKTLDLQLVVQ